MNTLAKYYRRCSCGLAIGENRVDGTVALHREARGNALCVAVGTPWRTLPLLELA